MWGPQKNNVLGGFFGLAGGKIPPAPPGGPVKGGRIFLRGSPPPGNGILVVAGPRAPVAPEVSQSRDKGYGPFFLGTQWSGVGSLLRGALFS